MGKKSKKGTSRAGGKRPAAGQGKVKHSSKKDVDTVCPPVIATTDSVAAVAAPSANGLETQQVPIPVIHNKSETLSPVSAADTADETVSYDGDGDSHHLNGKAFGAAPEQPVITAGVASVATPGTNGEPFVNLRVGQKVTFAGAGPSPLSTSPSSESRHDGTLSNTQGNQKANRLENTKGNGLVTETSADGTVLIEDNDPSNLVIETCLSEEAPPAGTQQQQQRSVSFSSDVIFTEARDVVIQETNDASRSVFETCLVEDVPQEEYSADGNVLISENNDASRSVIEVSIATTEEEANPSSDVADEKENDGQEEKNEPVVNDELPKEEALLKDTIEPSLSAKLDDLLAETTENFFAAEESKEKKRNSTPAGDKPQQEGNEPEKEKAGNATNVSSLLTMPGMEASFIKYAETFAPSTASAIEQEKTKEVSAPSADSVVAPTTAAQKQDESSTALNEPPATSEPVVSTDNNKTSVPPKVDSVADVNTATLSNAKLPEPEKEKAVAPESAAAPATVSPTTLMDATNSLSLTEPGPAEKHEKQKDCSCVIL